MSRKLVHFEAVKQELQASRSDCDELSHQLTEARVHNATLSAERAEQASRLDTYAQEDGVIAESIGDIISLLIHDPSTPDHARALKVCRFSLHRFRLSDTTCVMFEMVRRMCLLI